MANKSNFIIDLRDSIASMSLLKVTQVFGEMKPSQILEIRGSDPDTRRDLFKVLPQSAYEILWETGSEEGEGEYQVRIQKRI